MIQARIAANRAPRKAAGAAGRRARRALAASAVLGLMASVASAVIPAMDRVATAVADSNRSSGRTQALKFDVTLRIGGGDPIATGELVSHPSGMARLELVKRGDFIERHILQGTDHRVARNGRVVDQPREFLPPVFFLQSSSGVGFEAALRSYGIDSGLIGLSPCDEADCLVLGDPEFAPRVRTYSADGTELPSVNAGPEGSFGFGADDRPRATVWIDSSSYDVRRIQSADGVRVTLGPTVSFSSVRVPSWVEIQEPRHLPVRLEIKRAAAVNAPASAFNSEWMLAAPPVPGAPGPPSTPLR